MNQELTQLLELVKNPSYDIVSFDLFDTLIRRKVAQPEHVFWAVGQHFSRLVGDKGLVNKFYHARIHAGELSQKSARQQGREDSTLAEIYETLVSVLPAVKDYAVTLEALEVEEERRVLEVYPFGQRLFQAALDSGKRVIISSDQYLPISFLEERLKAFGYEGYEKLLLSGDIGLLKTTGSLYEWMTMSLGVERRRILHIGDNAYVDGHVATFKGVRGTVSPRSDRLAGHGGVDSSVMVKPSLASYAGASYLNRLADLTVAEAQLPKTDGIDYIGYTFYGPLLTYLATWLAEKLYAGKIDKIWLLARDSEGLSKAMVALHPDLADRIHYVYASRRMLVYPTGTLTGNEIFRHFESLAKSDATVFEFLEKVSFEGADFTPLKAHFEPSERMSDRGLRAKLERRLDQRCVELRDDPSSETRANLRGYYESFVGEAQRIGVFDLGWRGNLQRAIEQLFVDTDLAFTGYYIGQIFETDFHKKSIDAECFAFSYNYPHDVFEEVLDNIWALELIFSGTELSSKAVAQADGRWTPLFETDTDEKRVTREVASRLQNGAMRFITEQVLHDPILQEMSKNYDDGLELLREFLARPRAFEAKALGNLAWAINIEGDGKSLIASPKKMSGRHISKARARSSWPAGFDALQSGDALAKMRRYRDKRDRKRHVLRKIRKVLRGR